MPITSAEGDVRHIQAASGLCDTHHVSEMRATRVGGHAHRYLLAACGNPDRAAGRPLVGHVVSIFRRGFNVVFDEAGDPTWIAVQTTAVPLHPWAIEVLTVPRGIQVGLSVRADAWRIDLLPATDSSLCGPGVAAPVGHRICGRSQQLPSCSTARTVEQPRTADCALRTHDSGFPTTTARCICVPLRGAQVDSLRIAPYTPEEAELALSRLPLLERFLREAGACRLSDPFEPQINAVLGRWQASGDPSLLADLVGLGSGSTPAGDDVLVGLLAGLAARGSVRSDRGTLPSSGLALAARTTRFSEQALLAAAEQSFPEPLCLLVVALASPRLAAGGVEQRVRGVASLGASSGLSFLKGLAAALRS